MKIAFLLVVLAIGTAPLTAATPAKAEGEVGLGEKLRLGSIQVRPLRVVEDSRCPKDVACSSPNRVVVRTELRGPNSLKTRDFHIGDIREVEGAGSLLLADVSPSPTADAPIDPKAYRFTYQVSR